MTSILETLIGTIISLIGLLLLIYKGKFYDKHNR